MYNIKKTTVEGSDTKQIVITSFTTYLKAMNGRYSHSKSSFMLGMYVGFTLVIDSCEVAKTGDENFARNKIAKMFGNQRF